MIDKGIARALEMFIRQKTIFDRPYVGEVVDNKDPKKKGRVKVVIPELGFLTEDNGLWCVNRQVNQVSLPAIKKWVEVYFIAGDQSRPAFRGEAQEMDGVIPENFDGDPQTHLIFEDPDDREKYILYDAKTKELKINMDLNVNDDNWTVSSDKC